MSDLKTVKALEMLGGMLESIWCVMYISSTDVVVVHICLSFFAKHIFQITYRGVVF